MFLAGIGALVQGYQDSLPDVLLLDTLVNDAASFNGIEPIRHSTMAQPQEKAMGAGFEALVRGLRKLLPSTLIIVVVAGCPLCLGVRNLHVEVAKHYQLPLIDYATLVERHNRLGRPNGPQRFWASIVTNRTGQPPEFTCERAKGTA